MSDFSYKSTCNYYGSLESKYISTVDDETEVEHEFQQLNEKCEIDKVQRNPGSGK